MAIDFPASPVVGQEFVSATVTYVYNGYGWLMKPQANPYVAKAGDVMTGQLELPSSPAPVAANAVRKDYVDAAASAADAAMKVYAAPLDALAYNGMQINGSMEVSQERGNTASALYGYVCDGWLLTGGIAGLTFQTSATPSGPVMAANGFKNYFALVVTTGAPSLIATDSLNLLQRIEGCKIARLGWGFANAKPLTIGFWCNHSRTGTYSCAIRNSPVTHSYIASYTQNVASTWEYKTITIPGPTVGTWAIDNTAGILVSFCMTSGSTNIASSANTWLTGSLLAAPGQVNGVAANTDSFNLAGIVILPGIYAPTAAQSPLIMRPYDQEILTCKRYWNQGQVQWDGWIIAGQSRVSDNISFEVPMRTSPTFVLTNNGGTGVGAPGAAASAFWNGAEIYCATAAAGAAAFNVTWKADARL